MPEVSNKTRTPMSEKELARCAKLRVCLFHLNVMDEQWSKRGCGQISCFEDYLKQTSLIVVSETDGSLLLMRQIQPHILYKKEQGRFIVWKDDDDVVYGLSFQEYAGCDEIHEMICQIQRNYPKDIPEAREEDDSENHHKVQEPECFEEMLDLEHIELNGYEKNVLDQIIQLVNNIIAPSTFTDEKVPRDMEYEMGDHMMEMFSDGVEDDADWNELHDSILYLLRRSQ